MNNKVFEKKNLMSLIPLIVMALLSITPLFGMKLSGIAVFFGVIFFFIYNHIYKIPGNESGLDLKSIPNDLKSISIWFWIMMPIMLDVISILLSKVFVPEYISHVISRTESMVSLDKIAILIPQLAILALGEEIANRALFQKLTSKYLPIIPSILVTSLFFAIAHVAEGSLVVVIYDVLFVFLNSVIYGIVLHKTNNAYISTLSHLISNLFGCLIIIFI